LTAIKEAEVNDASQDADEFAPKKREKTSKEKVDEENEYKQFLKELSANRVNEIHKKATKYWTDENVSEDDKFLRNFIIKKGWLSKQSTSDSDNDDDNNDNNANTSDNTNKNNSNNNSNKNLFNDEKPELVDEDEEDLERQELFEKTYNFRFEEPGGAQIQTFSRLQSESMRKPDDRRKKKRQAKKERLESEKKKRTEEKKQLMKLKKLQIVDRLKEIQKITGIQDEALKGVDLDEEFDPEKYEKQMASVFNDDYYNKNDDDEKPVFDDDENEFYDYYDENFHEQTGDRTVGESGNVGEEEGIVGGGTSTEEGTGDEPKSDKGKNKKKNKKKEELSYFHTVSAAEKFLAEKKKRSRKIGFIEHGNSTKVLGRVLSVGL